MPAIDTTKAPESGLQTHEYVSLWWRARSYSTIALGFLAAWRGSVRISNRRRDDCGRRERDSGTRGVRWDERPPQIII